MSGQFDSGLDPLGSTDDNDWSAELVESRRGKVRILSKSGGGEA